MIHGRRQEGEMSENGNLTMRYVTREKEILERVMKDFPMTKHRHVPVPLFRKLLDAAAYAIEHGFEVGRVR